MKEENSIFFSCRLEEINNRTLYDPLSVGFYKGDRRNRLGVIENWNNNSWEISKKQNFKYDNNKLISHTTTYNNTQEISF